MTSELKTPQPVLVADLFQPTLDSLISLLKGLDESDWERSTACPGWSVKDVALHLLGGEIGNLSSRRDGHTVSGRKIDGWEELVRFINNWNDEWVGVGRRISPSLLIDLMELTGTQMNDYFQSLDPFAMGGAVSWAGDNPAPVWLDLAREYTERWHHQQHIRDAVQRPGLKEPEYFAPVLTTFVRAMPRAFEQSNAPDGTIVALEIQGPSGGVWSVRKDRNRWEMFEGTPESSDVRIVIDEDDAWRLFTRGLSREQAIDRVRILGDESLGKYIFEMVSIIA